MKFGILFTVLFAAISAPAEVKIQSISGFSNLKNFASGGLNNAVEVYGGLAGAATAGNCGSASSGATCNSCEDGVAAICNERRVHANLELVVTFASTTLPANGSTATPRMTFAMNNSANNNDTVFLDQSSPVPVTTTNQIVSVRTTWANILQKLDVAQNPNHPCDDKPCTQIVRVGLDSDSDGLINTADAATFTLFYYAPKTGTTLHLSTDTGNPRSCTGGLCNFQLFPGDEKAYILNDSIVNPSEGLPINAVFIMCTEGTDFTSIPGWKPGMRRASVANQNITDDFVEGFSNGVDYVCRSASEDIAGNILYWSGLSGGVANQDIICPLDDNADTSLHSDACHQVKPDEVLGLFAEKQNCFIATAAYGSAWENEVNVLRKFRSRFLMKSAIGRQFVSWYYHNAPPVAGWIAESENRRQVARWALTPIFATAYMTMNWPMTTLFLGLGVLVLLGVFVLRRINKVRTQG